jgi:hypothetical protein
MSKSQPGPDFEMVLFSEHGVLSGGADPGIVVETSSIGGDESATIRARLP